MRSKADANSTRPCRILGPPKRKEEGRKGLRVCKAPVAGSYHRVERVHFSGSLDGTKEAPRGIEDELGKRQRVFGSDGVEIRMRKSGFDSFEDSLGRKRVGCVWGGGRGGS